MVTQKYDLFFNLKIPFKETKHFYQFQILESCDSHCVKKLKIT